MGSIGLDGFCSVYQGHPSIFFQTATCQESSKSCFSSFVSPAEGVWGFLPREGSGASGNSGQGAFLCAWTFVLVQHFWFWCRNAATGRSPRPGLSFVNGLLCLVQLFLVSVQYEAPAVFFCISSRLWPIWDENMELPKIAREIRGTL